MDASFRIEIARADAREFKADVLVLKHAQGFFGLDSSVASRLRKAGLNPDVLQLAEGESLLLPSRGVVAAPHLLFVGVGPLSWFRYGEVEQFAHRALGALRDKLPECRHVAVTVHGVNTGLDEAESFLSQINGFFGAGLNGQVPEFLERITFVERHEKRSDRLSRLLSLCFPEEASEDDSLTLATPIEIPAAVAVATSSLDKTSARPVAFVAMPFHDTFDDIYHYGIHQAVRDAGYICERADQSSFTGDILQRVKDRIRAAALVIGDLTENNPNVCLEIGLAWGYGVPTVLISKKPEQLVFNLRGQRCLGYKQIRQLEETLREELRQLARES